MMQLVFFLEERSAEVMLKGLLPRLLPKSIYYRCVTFEGKQDLEKQLPGKLRGWLAPNCGFVVLRDQDSGDCYDIKQALARKCCDAGKPDTLVRIACHELESWYLGDLAAVEKAIGPSGLSARQGKSRYRVPDSITNAADELQRIAPEYQKVASSREIGSFLSLETNKSTSFHVFITGIKRLVEDAGL
ncbi:MAG: DUF4276 family protein [Mariprofundaceae bacterium]